MSRRRYISTTISDDKVVARVEKKYGDFAGLLYERMIPHAEDDATIIGDAEELLAIIFPHRRDKTVEDVIAALEGIEAEGLIAWDRVNEIIYFPTQSFYKYQTYIREDRRRNWEYRPSEANSTLKTANSAEHQRTSAQNTASVRLSHSLSHSVTHSHSVNDNAPCDGDSFFGAAQSAAATQNDASNEADAGNDVRCASAHGSAGHEKANPSDDEATDRKKRFVPPMLEEAEEYFEQYRQQKKLGNWPPVKQGYRSHAEEFIDFHSSRNWILSNRQKASDWKGCARTWIGNMPRFATLGASRSKPSSGDVRSFQSEVDAMRARREARQQLINGDQNE